MTRKLLWPILAIGIALVALPLILQMPSRATAGERMMSDFQPIMQPDQVQQTADYYYNVFVPLDTVFTPIVSQATVDKFNAYLKGFSGMQGNVADYEAASNLPPFTLLPWFFIVPGLLLIGLAGWGLLAERREFHVSHAATPRPSH